MKPGLELQTGILIAIIGDGDRKHNSLGVRNEHPGGNSLLAYSDSHQLNSILPNRDWHVDKGCVLGFEGVTLAEEQSAFYPVSGHLLGSRRGSKWTNFAHPPKAHCSSSSSSSHLNPVLIFAFSVLFGGSSLTYRGAGSTYSCSPIFAGAVLDVWRDGTGMSLRGCPPLSELLPPFEP